MAHTAWRRWVWRLLVSLFFSNLSRAECAPALVNCLLSIRPHFFFNLRRTLSKQQNHLIAVILRRDGALIRRIMGELIEMLFDLGICVRKHLHRIDTRSTVRTLG